MIAKQIWRTYITAFLVILAFMVSGCSKGDDKKKFGKVEQSVREMEKALDDMVDYTRFAGLFDSFSNELLAVRDTVRTDREKKRFDEYAQLLATYQDGLLLWEYKVESTRYAWIPEGVIYLEPKIKPIAVRYNLPVESHVVELTQHEWKSVPADSLHVIWDKAREQFRKMPSR
jgi:hypothetical protein